MNPTYGVPFSRKNVWGSVIFRVFQTDSIRLSRARTVSANRVEVNRRRCADRFYPIARKRYVRSSAHSVICRSCIKTDRNRPTKNALRPRTVLRPLNGAVLFDGGTRIRFCPLAKRNAESNLNSSFNSFYFLFYTF